MFFGGQNKHFAQMHSAVCQRQLSFLLSDGTELMELKELHKFVCSRFRQEFHVGTPVP